MAEFRKRPLGDLTINLDRRRVPVKASDRRPGPYPYYGASGVVDYVDAFIFDGLHLLVAEDGENLRSRKTPIAFLADGQFWVNNHAHILQANSENDIRFLSYAVESGSIAGYITGSTQPKLSQAALSALPIVAPPLAEQQGIAATLGALDQKIGSNSRIVDLAKRILDTLAAELSGANTPLVPLSELAIVSRETIDPSMLGETRVDHFSIPAFDAGTWPERVVASSIKSNKLAVRRASILVSRLNPRINRTWWSEPEAGVVAMASTEFLVLTTEDPTQLGALWLAVRSEYFMSQLERRVTGTSGSHQRIRPADAVEIDVPDIRLLSPEDMARASALIDLVHQRRRESEHLRCVREALIPELLSGRIRVPEAREEVEVTA